MRDIFNEELELVSDKFPKYRMKMMLGDFSARVGREEIFKRTTGKYSFHEILNVNEVKVVNFAVYKSFAVKSTMFLHHKIHKLTWKSPDGKTIKDNFDRQRQF
jgi:hypothetical protein